MNQGIEIPFDEYFWTLKSLYPGDSDFGVNSYPNLCYGFVILSVMKGSKIRQQQLFEYERPIASIAALFANSKRDPKKRKEPYGMDQFCLYKPKEAMNIPAYVYGSAALVAIEKQLFPHWGLFCYKELAASANPDYVPGISIALCDDAFILHPTIEDDGVRGLLVAMESAGGQFRTITDDNGVEYKVTIPPVETKFVAIENAKLYFSRR